MTTFDLRRAHPEVRKMKQILDASSPYRTTVGLLDGLQRHKVLRIKVSKEQLNRALFVMDSLVRALVQRGAEFVRVKDSELSEIRIDSERIECLLIEETKRTERLKDESDSSWQFNKWQLNPTGHFRFEIQEYTDSACQKKWNDSKQHNLEEQIENIVNGLFICAKDIKQLAIKREEQNRQWEEARRRREEAARQETLELGRRKNLEDQAQRWMQSINLCAFIDASEKQMTNAHGQLQTDSVEMKWLVWQENTLDV